jgi:AraC-like DNA-binding protein
MDDRERGTIAICFVREALVEVRRRGLDADAMLREADIAPSLLAAPQARVSPDRYGALWHAIAQALDDEFFGMDSHPMRHGSFTLLCHSVLHAGTLERALRRALRFLRLVLDDLHGSLEVADGVARIDLRERGEPRRMFAYGAFLMILHGLACWLVGRRIPLLAAEFRCPAPDHMDEYQVLLCPRLAFERPRTFITFDAAYLGLPTLRDEAAMKLFLRSAPANFLVKYRHSDSLTAGIRRRLRQVPPADWPDFDQLARALHAAPATLRRRLDEEGQTYRAIKDELRRDMAITYLGPAGLTVGEVATRLGFAEPSAFHRAFKKWTGGSPGEYRRAQERDPPEGRAP